MPFFGKWACAACGYAAADCMGKGTGGPSAATAASSSECPTAAGLAAAESASFASEPTNGGQCLSGRGPANWSEALRLSGCP